MKRPGMKSFVSLGIAVTFSIGAVISAYAMDNSMKSTKPAPKTTASGPVKTYVGYLIDGHCASTGIDDETGKINVKKNPEKHTTSCLKIKMCMDEGLGIMVKQNGTYRYYSFDKAGSKKADDSIMMMTKRKFGNKVSVTGSLRGSVLKVSSIKEAK